MKTKKFLLVLLTIVTLLVSSSVTVFAADPSDENSDVTTHTIVISIPAGDSTDEGIVPYIWGQFNPSTVSNNVYNTPSFYIPDRYFAFEASAIGVNGNRVEENFGVSLKYNSGTKSFLSGKANGTVYKNDWIDVVPGTYYFSINNATSSDISISITYYSW